MNVLLVLRYWILARCVETLHQSFGSLWSMTCLAMRWGQNPLGGTYLRFEAHVEHSISLIKYNEGRAPQGAPLHLDQIDQASWCADDSLFHTTTSALRIQSGQVQRQTKAK